MNTPLSISLRPKKIEDVIGQEHLIGEDKIFSNLVKNKKLFSMILYGNPGIGKTTIAKVLVNELGLKYKYLDASINNKHDFDTAIEEAKLHNGLVLIVDEIHRMNKDKQDILLPRIENGLITLIGLTSSNPYHSINLAIRSRCHLFELKELKENDIRKAVTRAISSNILIDISIDEDAIDYICTSSSGDLRSAYNLLEIAYYGKSNKTIDIDYLKEIRPKNIFISDKNEDSFYDFLSALQKSIRGSDTSASIHYLARLITLGDLEAICRRLIVIAYEDIGLANPNLCMRTISACDACLKIGLKESRIILSNVVIDMSLSKKSNTAYLAIDKALSDIEKINIGSIPDNIRLNSKTYLYPHNYKNNYIKQNYMPKELANVEYYKFNQSNKYEEYLLTMKNYYDKLKKDS